MRYLCEYNIYYRVNIAYNKKICCCCCYACRCLISVGSVWTSIGHRRSALRVKHVMRGAVVATPGGNDDRYFRRLDTHTVSVRLALARFVACRLFIRPSSRAASGVCRCILQNYLSLVHLLSLDSCIRKRKIDKGPRVDFKFL